MWSAILHDRLGDEWCINYKIESDGSTSGLDGYFIYWVIAVQGFLGRGQGISSMI
jgi:hypothetical protein